MWCRGVRLVTSAAGREEHITSTDNATVKHFAKLVRNRGEALAAAGGAAGGGSEGGGVVVESSSHVGTSASP